MDEQAVTVYYRPMLLIFCTILVSKLLRSMVTPLSSRVPYYSRCTTIIRPILKWVIPIFLQVVRLVTPLPDTVHKLRSEIAVAKKKASSISITVCPTHTHTHTHTHHCL